MSNERFMLQWCLARLISLLVAMRIVSQACIMPDDVATDSSLSIVEKILSA